MLVSIVLLVGMAPADTGDSLSTCAIDASLDASLPASIDPAERGRVGRVAASDLPELLAGRLLVDVRPAGQSTGQPLAGALAMDLQGLRTLVRASARDVLVIGVGDDDDRLAERLAAWPEADRIRIVAGGAPAVVLHGNQVGDGQSLASLLEITPQRALAAAIKRNLLLIASAEADSPFLVADAVIPETISLDDSTAVMAIHRWLKTENLESRGGFLLIDSDGRRAQALAPALSQALQGPVFYVTGGWAAIDAHAKRFADMNRQPRIPVGGCR